jgi:hypothetical protein
MSITMDDPLFILLLLAEAPSIARETTDLDENTVSHFFGGINEMEGSDTWYRSYVSISLAYAQEA